MFKRLARILIIAFFAFGLGMAFSGSAQAARGWWATMPNNQTAGPFSDGIAAALYSQKAFWPSYPASKCYYGYHLKGYPATSTCIGYTSTGAVRQGYGALQCNAGERLTEGGGGCVPVPASDTGDPMCIARAVNPVDLVNGNKHQTATDFMSQGPQLLGLIRSYNSQQAYYAAKIGSGRFGKGWRSEFDTAAFYYGTGPATPTNIHIILPGGRESVFVLSGGLMKPAYWDKQWNLWSTPRKDVDESVALIGGVIWRFIGRDDTAYDFNLTGQLTQIRTRGGYVQTFSYNPAGKNTGIADNLGRNIAFTYNAEGLTDSVTDPDGKVYRYVYKNQLVLPPGVTVQVNDQPSWVLEKVIYPDATPLSDADNPSLT